jgi:hypothetical protein
MNTTADEEIREAMSQAVEKVRELHRNVQAAPTKDDEEWFRNLLLGILTCALLDYYSVKIGAEKSVYLLAWACRNLLELKVTATFAVESEKNAIDLKGDLIIDAKEFYELLTKHHQASHKKVLVELAAFAEQEEGPVKVALEEALRRESQLGPRTSETDAEAAAYRQLMIEMSLSPDAKAKRSGQLARLLKQSEEFDPMFRVCSKIMHRTMMSIAASITPGSLDAVIPLLPTVSENSLLAIYGSIDEHFKVRGVQLPEK